MAVASGDRWAHLQADCYTVELSLFSWLLLDAVVQLCVASRPSPVHRIPLTELDSLPTPNALSPEGKPDASPHALVFIQVCFFFLFIINSKPWGSVSGPSVIEVLGPTCLSAHFLSSAHLPVINEFLCHNICKMVFPLEQLIIHKVSPFLLCICNPKEEEEKEEGGHIGQKLGISSLLPAKELAWVWTQQKAWRAYPSKRAGHRHPD